MKHLILTTAILLASIVTTAGLPMPDDLSVTCDGGIWIKPTLGEMSWQGHVEVGHPRFQLTTNGSVAIFGGPAIRRTSPPGTKLQRKDLSLEQEWISLVAIGDVTVRITGPDGASSQIHARRLVYLPRKDQFLIDGEPWSPGNTERQ